MDTLAQDLRFAFRTLAKSPAFTAAAVLTLALGLGANTAVFSVVDAVLLDPLDFPEEDRLVTVWEDHRARGGPATEWTGRSVFREWREAETFSGLTVTVGWSAAIAGGDRPEMIPGAAVSPEYFRVLGAEPSPGRGFLPEEEAPGRDRVVVLSRSLWEQRFGAAPELVGSTIEINGEPFTVVGIAPEGLRSPIQPDARIWTPLSMDPAQEDWGNFYLRVIGRLAPGVGAEAADADRSPDPEIYVPFAQRPSRAMRVVARAERPAVDLAEVLRSTVAEIDPAQPVSEVVSLETLVRRSLDSQRFVTGLLSAFAAVALALAAVGIYGVMSHAVGRRTHELGVRMALGARPREVLGLVLRQGAGLVGAGLATGAVAAWAVGRGVERLLYGVDPGDPVTYAAVAVLLAASALAATLIPARRAARIDPVEALRSE